MADVVEMRCDVDRLTCDTVDGVAKARGISRTQMLIKILDDWARDKRHEATMVLRLTKVTGVEGETSSNSGEKVR